MKRLLACLAILLTFSVAVAQESGIKTKIITIDGNLNTEMPSYAIGDGDYSDAWQIDPHRLPVMVGMKYDDVSFSSADITFGSTKSIFILNAIDYHDPALASGYRDQFYCAAMAQTSLEVALFWSTGKAGSGSWAKLTGTQNTFDTTTKYVGLLEYKKKIFAVGGNGVKYFDPATRSVQLLSNVPTAANDHRYISTYIDRLFTAGSLTSPSVVHYSGTDVPTLNDWDGDSGSGTGEIVVFDGGLITGLYTYNDSLIIFTNKSIWQLTGSTPDDWYLKQVFKGVGAICNAAICEGRKALYFIGSDNNFYAISGNSIGKISSNFSNRITSRKLNDLSRRGYTTTDTTGFNYTPPTDYINNRYPCGVGFWDDYVFFTYWDYLNDLSGTRNCFVFSEKTGKWSFGYINYLTDRVSTTIHPELGPYGFVVVNPQEIAEDQKCTAGLYALGDFDLRLVMTTQPRYVEGAATQYYSEPAQQWVLYTKSFQLSPMGTCLLRRIGVSGEWKSPASLATAYVSVTDYVNPHPIYNSNVGGTTYNVTAGLPRYGVSFLCPTPPDGTTVSYSANYSMISIKPAQISGDSPTSLNYHQGYHRFGISGTYSTTNNLYIEYYEEPYPREQ